MGTKKGLFQLSENHSVKHFNNEIKLSISKVLTIYEDKNNNLWVGTYGNGLIKIKNNKAQVFTINDGLSSNKIYRVTEDKQKNLWIGTYGGGLNRLTNDKFSFISSDSGLTNNMVLSIFEDFENNLWIGTYSGLNRIKDGKLITLTTKDGLLDNDINAVLEDNSRTLWIGTWDKGVSKLNNNNFTNLTTMNGLSSNVIKSLYMDTSENLWIGTYGGGLNKYKDGKINIYTTEDGLPENNISSILQDKNKNLWIGTYGNGLSLFKNGNFKTFSTQNGLSSNLILSILEDSKQNMWVGTKGGGINKIKNGKIEVLNTKKGLSNNTIYKIYQDNDGLFFIGTNNGLNLVRNNIITVITSKHGLFNDTIFTILEDGKSNLWMSCNKGIFKVNKKDILLFEKGMIDIIKSDFYDTDDGMKSRECNGGFQPSGVKTKSGKLYIPTIKGLVEINPLLSLENNYIPPVYIESIKVDGKVVKEVDDLILKAHIKRLEFKYTALSYTSPKKVKFKYMLEGFDSEWIEAGTNRTSNYTNLSDGNYTFKVKACNNDGIWNEVGAKLNFKKLPHFHETFLFYLLIFIIITLLMFYSYYLKVKKIKIKQKELSAFNLILKKEVETQTLLLQEKNQDLDNANKKLNKNQFEIEKTNQQLKNTLDKLTKTYKELKDTQSKMIQQARLVALGNLVAGVSHEISNPLSSVMGGTLYLKRYLDKTENLISELSIKKEEESDFSKIHSRAKRSIEMLKEGHSRIRKITDNFRSYLKAGDVSKEEYDLKEGVNLCFKLMDKRIDEQKINVNIDISEDIPTINCRPNELNQVLTNLIINSLDVMPDGGKITINASIMNNNIEIVFSDTGPGIEKEHKESIFDPFFTTKPPSEGTGLGLYISSEIIKRHGGELLLQEKESGTSFLIKLPLNPA